jgi:hypothetical protein
MNAEALDLTRKFAEVTRERSLWELRDLVNEAAQLAVDDDGVVSSDWQQILGALNFTVEQKVEACHVVASEEHERAVAYRRLSDKFARLASIAHKREERLKAYVLDCIERMGLTQVKTPTIRACVEKSPPSVELLVPEGSVPAEFRNDKPSVDLKSIGLALKAGGQLAFAKLVTDRRHLRWR